MMPYQSDKQRRFMHAQHPEIAAKWDAEIREQKRKKRVKKNLTPVEPQFDMSNPDFNYKAARKMYDIVMKMDADEAVIFSEMLINDVLDETISKNLPTLQRHLDEVVSKRIEKIKKAALRTVSKGMTDNAREYAQAIRTLEEITKAQTPQDYGYVWREQDFRRDPRTGQFQTKVKHSQKKPIRESTAAAMGIGGMEDQRYKKLSPEQKAKYQDEYRQLQQFLSTVTASTGGQGNQEVLLHYRDRGGNRFVQRHSGGPEGAKDLLLDENTTLVGAVARPTALTAGGAAFGLVPALGERGVRGANAGEKGFSTFANDWYDAGSEDPSASNAKLYGRVGAGSKYLGDIAGATGNPKLLAAAKVGQFVGDHGAEAEQVFGPAARKTAYRYRGTEKTPDKSLVSAYAQGIRQAKSYNAQEQRTTRGGRGVTPAVSQMGRQRVSEDERAPSHDETLQGVYKIEEWFRSDKKRMPDPKLYRLQLASGNTPPSEGVLINRDGQIVSQAIGYGDDHYLPFNLKNLKELKGGQYVRTRSVGGPTSEDIYTGLLMGARRVTVVSRSGTYTIEFDPELRGGRRHNDKAGRMTRRYEQLLDAVQSKQVDREPIDAERKQIIREKVREEFSPEMGYTGADRAREVARREDEYKANPEMDEIDEEWLRRRIEIETRRAPNEAAARQVAAELTADAMAEKELKYSLNARGYAAALQALEEQFPYYIKTTYKPRRHTDADERGEDKGYVEPGRNRPTAAQGIGLFGTEVNPGQKRQGLKASTASRADYQDRKAQRRTGAAPTATAGATEAKPAENGEKKQFSVEDIKQQRNIKTAAVSMRDHLFERTDPAEQYRPLEKADAETLTKPENMRLLNELFTQAQNTPGVFLDRKVIADFEVARGNVDRPEYQRGMLWPGRPPQFREGEAYEPGTPLQKKIKEIKVRDAHAMTKANNIAAMTEDEWKAEYEALELLREWYKDNKALPSPAIYKSLGGVEGSRALRHLRDVDSVEDQMDKVLRQRALQVGLTEDQKKWIADETHPGIVVGERPPKQSELSTTGKIIPEYTEVEETLKNALDYLSEIKTDARAKELTETLSEMAAELQTNKARFGTDITELDKLTKSEKYRNAYASAITADQNIKNMYGPTGTKRLPPEDRE